MKGLKKAKTPEEIAKQKGVPLEDVIRQLQMGVKVEKEHTTDEEIAKHIALQHLEELPTTYYSMLKKMEKAAMNEDLRNWFNPKHPDGGWKRINSKGEAVGPCARGSSSEPKPKCMSNKKRKQLSKKRRAAAVRAKRKHDPVADRAGKGGKPVNVSNFGKGRISEAMEYLAEKNVPTNPELWSKAKSLARSKFDVYPSAYANGWAAKWYKSKGGGWKTKKRHKKKVNEEFAIFDPKIRKYIKGQETDPTTGQPLPIIGRSPSDLKRLAKSRDGTSLIKVYNPKDEASPISESVKYFYENQIKKLLPENHIAIQKGNEVDDEGEMARNQLDTISSAEGKNQQLPAWVQSKITKATDGIDTVADYMSSDSEEELNENTTPRTGLKGLIQKIKGVLREDLQGNKESYADYQARLQGHVGAGRFDQLVDHHDKVHAAMGYLKSLEPHYKKAIPLVIRAMGGSGGNQHARGMVVTGVSGMKLTGRPTGAGGHAASHKRDVANHIKDITGLHRSFYASLRPDHYHTLISIFGDMFTEKGKQRLEEAKKPYKGFVKGKNHPEGGLSRSEARRQGIHAGIETKREAQKKGGFGKLSGKTQKRRKSFCSRMCGMKKRRTSAKTARDPKSKINAALRVWGCRCESYNPTCDVCEYEKQLLMHEEVVNKRNKGTMTKAEIKKRDEKAKGIKPQPIKGDTDDESRHRIATFITLRARGGGKKKKKKNIKENLDGTLDTIQAVGDVAGTFDPTGIVDLGNAGLSVKRALSDPKNRGKHLRNAGIRVVSAAVPFVGDVAKVGIHGSKLLTGK